MGGKVNLMGGFNWVSWHALPLIFVETVACPLIFAKKWFLAVCGSGRGTQLYYIPNNSLDII